MNFKNILKIVLYICIIISSISYIIYRVFFTIPTSLGMLSLIFSIILLLVEISESINFFIYFFNILIVEKKAPKLNNTNLGNLDFPDVDVFIATYNEDEEILQKTISACINMDYPDKSKVHIYLCDDGNRNNIKLLANKLNINYLYRNKNKNAKAGNYNYALNKTHSPYIAIFDADMVPTKDFLLSTIPYFLNTNENIGFVQSPQSFSNPDIYQYRFRLEDTIPFEQDYFYNRIQIAKNKFNSVVCCGTNVVFSRKALQDAGNFATKSISEDIATGMLIESKGYKCIAIDKVIAYGNNTNDINSFIKQRTRWSRGCIQILKNYKIFTNKGLSFRQKLDYYSCISYWLFGIRRLFYFIAPLLFSIFGIIIINCNLKHFLMFWIPNYVFKRFALDKLEGNTRSATWNKIYETILSPILGFEVFKELLGFTKTAFDVTNKTPYMYNKKNSKNIKLCFLHILFFILNILGLILCIKKVSLTNYSIYILSFIWIISNLFYLLTSIIFDFRNKENKYKDFVPNKVKTYTKKSFLLLFFKRSRNA